MKQIIGNLLIVLFVFLAPQIATAQESPGGVINGEVVNGTEGRGIEAGKQVSMLIYQDGDLVETKTTETDNEGKFQFAAVSTKPGYEYMMHINYAGVNYYAGEWTVFGDGETIESAVVNVCEPTTSDEFIKITHAHRIIVFEEGRLDISDSFSFSNYGDRTYIGNEDQSTQDNNAILIFSLPDQAEAGMEFFENYISLGNNTFADPLPFPPGDRQLDYSYKMPAPDPRDCTIPFHIHYPIDTLRVMVQSNDVEVTSSRMTAAAPVDTQSGEQYIQLISENLSGGETLHITISPSEAKINWASLSLWMIAGLFVVAIVVFLLKLGKKRSLVRTTSQHKRAEKKAQLLELKRHQQ